MVSNLFIKNANPKKISKINEKNEMGTIGQIWLGFVGNRVLPNIFAASPSSDDGLLVD